MVANRLCPFPTFPLQNSINFLQCIGKKRNQTRAQRIWSSYGLFLIAPYSLARTRNCITLTGFPLFFPFIIISYHHHHPLTTFIISFYCSYQSYLFSFFIITLINFFFVCIGLLIQFIFTYFIFSPFLPFISSIDFSSSSTLFSSFLHSFFAPSLV